MAADWPTKQDLDTLEKESSEHDRAWRLVRGLVRALKEERLLKSGDKYRTPKFEGERPDDYNQNIRLLEQRILKRKQRLTELEECRAFEQETERILISAIHDALNEQDPATAKSLLEQAALTYTQRMGPRST
jgi:hypothetical protein